MTRAAGEHPAPRCKGTMFLQARAFVTERRGKAAWDELVASLDPAALGGVVPIGWYPEALFIGLLNVMEATHRGEARALAKYEAEQDLTVIHRMFLRLANPAYVLEKAGDYWGRFHDTGTWRVERLAPNAARASLTGWGIVDPTACAYLTAYVRRMFELVGARDLVLAHDRCRCAGEAACVFEGSWR